MIIILSVNGDSSTNEVISWLNYFRAPWIRINEDDHISFERLAYKNNKITAFRLRVNNDLVDLTTVKSYWYRRGGLNNSKQRKRRPKFSDSAVQENINVYLEEEIDNVFNFVYKYLEATKTSINSFLSSRNDKSYFQFRAVEAGLSVPDSVTSVSQHDAVDFFERNGGEVITKSINELFSFNHEDKNYFTRTYPLSAEYLAECSPVFFPTLFQQYIPKCVELRIFYLNSMVYAMAIFSQQNEQTKIDFRNYDDEYPNRCAPFRLPADIEDKLDSFMKKVNLNCGSIDMILTPNNEYIFLEVNPVGQFGMVSFPCNYYLEKKIAQTLAQI